jgi:hypothetical protein
MNANALDSLSFDQLVPSDSKYLRKDDVGEDGLILTIAGFSREVVKGDDGDEDKVVMHFEEAVRPMILNKTNSQLLSAITGAKVAGDAKGKKLVVFNDPSVSFGGRVTGGIRIKRIPGPARAPATAPVRAVKPAPAREPGSDDDFNDTVDFG